MQVKVSELLEAENNEAQKQTPLHIASRNPDPSALKVIINSGVVIDSKVRSSNNFESLT